MIVVDIDRSEARGVRDRRRVSVMNECLLREDITVVIVGVLREIVVGRVSAIEIVKFLRSVVLTTVAWWKGGWLVGHVHVVLAGAVGVLLLSKDG